MEVGVGIHGEPGRRRVALMHANEIAEELIHAIVQDLDPRLGSAVLLMVNGLGATPSLELHVMYDAASRQLAKRGLKASRSIVGNYVTSLDMAGCSITVTVLNDELTALWDAPVHTPALRWRFDEPHGGIARLTLTSEPLENIRHPDAAVQHLGHELPEDERRSSSLRRSQIHCVQRPPTM
jgi:hypothetical protein